MFPLFSLVPEQVTGVGFTLDNTDNVLTLTLTWDRPSSELRIERYDVAITENELNQSISMVGGESDTTLTISSTQGSTYTFRVSAVSAVGSGRWSKRVTAGREYNILKSISHLTIHFCRHYTCSTD